MVKRRRSRKNNPYTTLMILAVVAVLSGSSFAVRLYGSAIVIIAALLVIGLLLIGLAWLFVSAQARHRQLALKALRLAQVDQMTGVQFEHYVAELLRHRGYKVTLTKVSGDYGVDIIAQKDGAKTAVQIKRYSSRLDQKPVREAVAGRAHYKCDDAMVITNNYFTPAARVLAISNDCRLVDGEELGQWVRQFSESASVYK